MTTPPPEPRRPVPRPPLPPAEHPRESLWARMVERWRLTDERRDEYDGRQW